MSHLSILPTVYTRSDLLESALRHEGFDIVKAAVMSNFNGDPVPVDLLARQGDAPSLGWTADSQGVLTMVGDLQRIARHHGLDARLQRVARHYALLSAVEAMDGFTPSVQITVQRA